MNHKGTIVCFGDSITMGIGLPEAARWTACLAFLLESVFPGKYDVYGRGIGGNTTALALDRIVTDVLNCKPAIVLIEFGINDAYVFPWSEVARVGLDEYKKNVCEIIRQVKKIQADPIVIINHPLTKQKDLHPQGNGRSVGMNLEPYNEVLRQIAGEERLSFVDLPGLLGPECLDGFLSEDGVHLSPEGNRLYARLVFESYFAHREDSADTSHASL